MKILRPIIVSLLFSSPCLALEPNVRAACREDYFMFCSNTSPGSIACKQCFRKFGVALTRGCKDALKSSVEFKAEYEAEYKKRHPGG